MSLGDDQPHNPFGNIPANPYAAPQSEEVEGTVTPTRLGEMTLNPWVSIWTKPRATIRQLIDTDASQKTPLVVALAGAAGGLGYVQAFSLQLGFAGGLIAGLLVGILQLFLVWLLFSWLIRITGSWMDGKATLSDMRIAYGWAQVPAIWMAPLSILSLVFVGANPEAAFEGAGDPTAAGFLMIIGVVSAVVGIWSFIIMCKAIGEAHLFSAWAGFASMFLAGLLVMIPIGVIVFAFVIATGG